MNDFIKITFKIVPIQNIRIYKKLRFQYVLVLIYCW